MKQELIDLVVDEIIEKAENAKLRELTKKLLNNGKKPWYLSKTLWLNIVAVIALLIQLNSGFVIPAEEQLAIITVANLLLRAITGKELGK